MLSEVLRTARAHVAGGWSEPFSLTSAGHICDPRDEGVARFSALDALLVAAPDAAAVIAAEDLLLEQLDLTRPRAERERWFDARDGAQPLTLRRWLEDPRRTHDDVLQLFGRCIARLRALESR